MAGAGYKLFNTGDVLTAAQVNTYLMEQTVMVFADAAARTAALSGVVSEGMICYLKDTNAVEVYNGSAWVASDDPNAIQNTIVDAKGDLIAASANDTPARLAVGSNGDTLVADSSTSTGLRWQGNYAAGKNKIINGNFAIAQRGTSVAATTGTGSPTYTLDRFRTYGNGSAGTITTTRETFTAGQTDVAGSPNYYARLTMTTLGSGQTVTDLSQLIEGVEQFSSQTVTLSFWAKASTTKSFTVILGQNFGSGGSSQVDTTLTMSASDITGTWTRFTGTATLPSISGKTVGTANYLMVLIRLNSPASAMTWDIANVQLELGNVATAFQTATGTLAGELAACQRYYYRQGGDQVYQTMAIGWATSTTVIQSKVVFPVSMRTTPTSLDSNALIFYDQVNAGITPTGLSLVTNQSSKNLGYLTVSSVTGATQYRSYDLAANNSTSAYLGFSAEL